MIGNLALPQILKHIEDEKLEIGITSYQDFAYELPHTHYQAFEYQYVISGHTMYIDIETNEEYEFKDGDFFIIKPGIKYAQKSKPQTKIIFIKYPPGNDKIKLDVNPALENWFKKDF